MDTLKNKKMKKILFIALIIFSIFTISSCNLFCEKGGGDVTKEVRELAKFDKIEIVGQAKVFLKQAKTTSVKVVIDSNLLAYVITEVSGNQLKIYEDKCLEEITRYKIFISTPNITKLYIDGAIQLKGEGKISTKKLQIITKGSGDIKLKLDVDELETETKGSGNLNLKGTADEFEIELKGAGSIDAYGLTSKNVDAEVSGAGTCKIDVRDKFEGSVSGSGKIYYKGNPKKVDTDVSDSGSIEAK